MVWDFLFGMLLAFFEFILSLLPAFEGPVVSVDGATTVGTALGRIDGWVNVPLLVDLVGIGVAALVAVYGVRAVLFIYERIPFKAT